MSMTPYDTTQAFVKWADSLPKSELLNLLEDAFKLGQLNSSKLWARFHLELHERAWKSRRVQGKEKEA